MGRGLSGVAEKLDKLGYDVVLLDKGKDVKEDSGIVSKKFFDHLPKSLAKHEIKQMDFISPSGKHFSLKGQKPFAWIADRKEVNMQLRKNCKSIISYERVLSLKAGKESAEVVTNENKYSAKLVIGCDGTYSLVRRMLGGKNPRIIYGILTRMKKQKGEIKVYLNKYYSPDFFAWLIPQTGEWGIMSGVNPKDYFEHFGKNENLEKGEVHASPIPMGFTQSSFERAMLVGEAAGQTKPLTGGGYVFGLECGQYAIRTADLCMQQKRYGKEFISSSYDRWKPKIGKEIKMQLLARRFYRRMTNKQIDNVFDTLGPHTEKLPVKDYDMLSKTFMQVPKLAIMKAALQAVF